MTRDEFASFLGVRNGDVIYTYESRGNFPRVENLLSICEKLNTDPTTLLLTDMSRSNKLPGGIGVPFYSMTVSGGAAGLGMAWEQEQPVGYVAVPDFAGCIAAFRVVGMSMNPEINDGDVIFIRHADSGSFAPTKIYLIITAEERMIKRVSPLPDKQGMLECRSSNPDFLPFLLPVSEVVAFYRVVGVIRLV